jgi:hypothetical protein
MTVDNETTQLKASQPEETKQAKKPKLGGPRGSGPKKPKSDEPPRKRGPPRPHRKLPQEILEGRISKLRKRIDKARGQLEDAERHIEGYDKEAKYREQDKKE